MGMNWFRILLDREFLVDRSDYAVIALLPAGEIRLHFTNTVFTNIVLMDNVGPVSHLKLFILES